MLSPVSATHQSARSNSYSVELSKEPSGQLAGVKINVRDATCPSAVLAREFPPSAPPAARGMAEAPSRLRSEKEHLLVVLDVCRCGALSSAGANKHAHAVCDSFIKAPLDRLFWCLEVQNIWLFIVWCIIRWRRSQTRCRHPRVVKMRGLEPLSIHYTSKEVRCVCGDPTTADSCC